VTVTGLSTIDSMVWVHISILDRPLQQQTTPGDNTASKTERQTYSF
jgi:hypothetical protein